MRRLFTRLLAGDQPGAAPLRQPERIHLVRDRELRWADRRQVAHLVQGLRAAGFETITTFRVAEMPALRLVGLAHPVRGYLGVVYEHRRAGVWCNLVALYERGGSLTVSNARRAARIEPRPGHERHLVRGASAARLHRALERRLRDRPLRRVEPKNFVQVFEDAYAEEIAWRWQRATGAEAAAGEVRDAELDRQCGPLFAAIARRDEVEVREILSRGVSPEGRDAHGRTPLMAAVASGEKVLVRALLDAGAAVDARAAGAPERGAPARGAPDRGAPAHGVPDRRVPGDAPGADVSGQTALTLAIEGGDAEIVATLVGAGADLGKAGEADPLQLAAREGDAEVVRALIAGGADVDRRGEDDMTPLAAAAAEGYLDVVEALVEAGADVAARCEGESAITLAASAGAREVVEFLAPRAKKKFRRRAEGMLEQAGPAPDTRARRLMLAATNGRAPVVRRLLAAGVPPDGVEGADAEGRLVTPLMVAAQEGHLEVMRLLIDAGADVNHSDGRDSPLTRALNTTLMGAEKQPAVIRLLVDSGAFTFDLSPLQRARIDDIAARS